MGELLLGIDIGTGSCKVCLMTSDGQVVGRGVRPYSPSLPGTGLVEQDPRDWYMAATDCLRQAEAATGLDLRNVAAVSVTGQMRGPTFLSREGEPVRPSILWNDQRCEREVAELQSRHASALRRITRNPLNTMCTLPKLLWVKHHERETWQKTATVLYPKDYVGYRLTGQRCTDHSDASGSSFYDLEWQTWSSEILNEWELPRGKLPEIYASTSVIGTVSHQAQQETGLREGIPVAAGASDATAEMLAVGVNNQRQCKVRLGTSGALSTIVDRLAGREDAAYYLWAYVQPGRWMVDVNTRACADATVWLKELFYHDCASADAAFERIEKEAGSVSPGADGLFFHPYLLGEDAPYWQPHLRASFFGLTKAHRRAHCARAVLEGTGFALRDARSVLGELPGGFQEHIFVGGGTQNAVWLGIVADILGVDGMVSRGLDASAGAAMLAGVAVGAFAGLEDAIASCRRGQYATCHNPENHRVYSRLFERYLRIKQALDAAYESMERS